MLLTTTTHIKYILMFKMIALQVVSDTNKLVHKKLETVYWDSDPFLEQSVGNCR